MAAHSPRKNYVVNVLRIGYRNARMEVKAADKAEAIKMALDAAVDKDFASEYDADYSADYAEEAS